MTNSSERGDNLRIALASDAEGHALKERLAADLREERYGVKDCGRPSDDDIAESPDATRLAAQAVLSGEADLAIVVCGSGAVASLAANKIPGVRACHCQDTFSARHGRSTAAANMLCLGARVVGHDLAAEIARAFLAEPVSERERHEQLRGKLDALEAEFADRHASLQAARSQD